MRLPLDPVRRHPRRRHAALRRGSPIRIRSVRRRPRGQRHCVQKHRPRMMRALRIAPHRRLVARVRRVLHDRRRPRGRRCRLRSQVHPSVAVLPRSVRVRRSRRRPRGQLRRHRQAVHRSTPLKFPLDGLVRLRPHRFRARRRPPRTAAPAGAAPRRRKPEDRRPQPDIQIAPSENELRRAIDVQVFPKSVRQRSLKVCARRRDGEKRARGLCRRYPPFLVPPQRRADTGSSQSRPLCRPAIQQERGRRPSRRSRRRSGTDDRAASRQVEHRVLIAHRSPHRADNRP